MICYYENRLTDELINELRESVGWQTFSKEQADNAIQMTASSVVAYDDDQPIAMGRLVGDGIYYLICDVIVKPDFQKRQVGRMIMDKLLYFAKSNLKLQEKCSVQLISAYGKEEFYKKVGFKCIPNEESGYGMQLVISNTRIKKE